MKLIKHITTLILFIAAALLLLAAPQANGQNALQAAWDAGITNGAVGGGYWRAAKGNYSIASYDLLYNLTKPENSLGAGLIIGGDYMWSGSKKAGVWNDIKGGFALNYRLAPLQSVGFTNFIVTVFGGDCVATPRSPGVGVGNITFVGADWSIPLYKNMQFHIAPAMQTRTGQGEFDRTYAGIQGFLSLKF